MPKKPKELTEEEIEEVLLAAKEDLAEIKTEMAELREKELKIRNHVADLVNKKEEGAVTETFGETKVCVTRNINYSIAAAEAERMKTEKPRLYKTILRFTPAVRPGEYKKNIEEASEYITTSEAPPTVEFK